MLCFLLLLLVIAIVAEPEVNSLSALSAHTITRCQADVGDPVELRGLDTAIRPGEPHTVIACVCDVEAEECLAVGARPSPAAVRLV